MSILITQADGIRTIAIANPLARNAVNGKTAQELYDAFLAFDLDDEAKVAVLTGVQDQDAPGHFCAGADLKAVSGGIGDNPAANPLNDNMNAIAPMGCTRLQLSKPVIAAISGYAVAGGIELALWCDLRVADETAIFGVFCRRFGVPLIDGGTVRLPRLIGMSRALDLILTGRPVAAQEALQIGLANRVVPAGQALAAAQKLAREIAAFPQHCMRNDRLSAYQQWGLSEREAMVNEFALGRTTIASGETVSGATRFKSGQGRSGVF
jgi:enoyl-CoA hydratase